MRRRPGEVRDAIVGVLEGRSQGASVTEITAGVVDLIGEVPASSVRSYLRLNTPTLFAKMDRAQYALAGFEAAPPSNGSGAEVEGAVFRFGNELLRGDTDRGVYGGLSTAQIVSLIVFCVLIALAWRPRAKEALA